MWRPLRIPGYVVGDPVLEPPVKGRYAVPVTEEDGGKLGGPATFLPCTNSTQRYQKRGYPGMGSRPSNTFQAYDRTQLQHVLDAVFPICVTAFDHRILATNRAYRAIFGDPGLQGFCHDSRPGPSCHTDRCPLVRIAAGIEEFSCEANKVQEITTSTFIVTSRPYRDDSGALIGIVESFQDITLRKEMETERERLIRELESALSEVKVLRGLLAICAACKKIRDEDGIWIDVENYVANRSEAEFTHGMCPDCLREHYPEHYKGG